MTKLFYPFLIMFCVFATLNLSAQNTSQPIISEPVSITGTLSDTVNLTNTGYASVSVLNASDSILRTFARTDESGKFTLNVKDTGKYLLLISHPSFATYVDVINVDKSTDIGTVIMTSKKQMLDEVVITGSRAIVIKGDTIEYNADSFKTRAFDNVDELLKKLPGIEIGKDGKIKAYGQEVKKMTVDGEEFFSDDPAIVSKTLRASSIDKVQVFDKKSDQAVFSGVDDGERIKTINLQLKENAKKGYFGKAQLGGGLPGYFENEAMINAFKGKQKIAAYGIMSNTNTVGLGWEEMNKYGGNSGEFTEGDDGNLYSTYTSDDNDWGGQYGGAGLPKSWVGGALYNNKWLNDSLIFNSNYKFSKKMNEGLENVTSQYILPDTQYFNKQESSNRNIAVKHDVNVTSEYWIDTSSSLKINLKGGYNTNQSLNRNLSEARDAGGTLINNNTSTQERDGTKKMLNADLLYRKRFRKKGRTFTANFTGAWKDSRNDGTLRSDYNLFSIDSSYAINQHKSDTNTSLTGKLGLTYTEPLSEKLNLQFNYNYNLNHNNATNNSYDIHQDNGGYTDVFNPFYSSHYLVNINQHLGGVGLKYNTKKINAGIGLNLSETHFAQEDKLFDTTYHYSYFNLLPKANFRYTKNQSTSISITYNGRAIQPDLTQLQPLRNNTDPLNITIGNPDLKQAYDHGFNANYNTYKMLTSQYLYFGSYFHVIQNSISNKQFIDNNGRSITQYVNVNGNYYGGFWSGGSRKIKDVEINAGINGEYYHNNNFINGLANINNRLTFTPNVGMRYNKDTTLDLDYNFSPGYNSNRSSIRPDIKTTYWQFDQALNFHISLPHKFRFGSEMTLNLRQKLDPAETNNNRFLWNLSLSRYFLKDRSLELKVYVNDLLNQNVGYSRYNTATYISERTYNTIRRYAMFSIIWNFTKTGGNAGGVSDEVMEIGE